MLYFDDKMMRRAATKLGLGFGNKISGCSRRWRRSASGLAAAGSESKSLYLCFTEKGGSRDERFTKQVIRRIGFHAEQKYPVVETHENFFGGYDNSRSLSTRIGSQIVMPLFGTAHFTLFDVSKSKAESKEFSTPKTHPQVLGAHGKLFCIDACANSLQHPDENFPFEVSENNLLEWRHLDPPPGGGLELSFFTSSFLEENRILGWEHNKPGVYCFDTTDPENGWVELSFALGNSLPFIDDAKPPIFVRDFHPVIGHFHLMFSFDPMKSPLVVNFYFMRDNCDSFHILKCTPLPLPKSCKKYTRGRNEFVSADFEFVPLGAKKVCLVLNKFFPCESPIRNQPRNVGTLLLVTFEYKIIANKDYDEPPIEIEARLLRTQRFGYWPSGQPDHYPNQTDTVQMTGVYLL